MMHFGIHEDGGTNVRFYGTADPKGSIPDIVKNKVAKKVADIVDKMCDYIREHDIWAWYLL